MTKPQPAVLEKERERLEKAIENLTTVDLLRLKAFATWRMRALGRKARGRTAEDLLQEAVLASWEGRRVWRHDVDLVRHLSGAMRSISTMWHNQRGEEYLASELGDDVRGNVLESLVVVDDLDDVLAAQKEIDTITALFARDPVASKVLVCLYVGYTANEARDVFGLSQKDYSAALRRIRRKMKGARNEELKQIENRKHEPTPVS